MIFLLGWCFFLNIGLVCPKQVSMAGTRNYISHYLGDVIICACPWYLLLAYKSSTGNSPLMRRGGWGFSQFIIFSVSAVWSKHCKETTKLVSWRLWFSACLVLNITFNFDMCHQSYAAVTPVKYECDSMVLTCLFAKSNIYQILHLTNDASNMGF